MLPSEVVTVFLKGKKEKYQLPLSSGDVLDGGRRGSQASRGGENCWDSSNGKSFLLYLLPSARRRVPPSSRTSFQVPKPLQDYFLVKAPPGQAQVFLPSLYMVKHNLSFQDQLVWYQAASWVFQSLGEVKWCPLCTSTQDPAALVTGMRAFSRDLQPQDLTSESPIPYCWSVSVLI